MSEMAKPKRRWFQFGLRTLLIAFLVLSLPFSWFAVRMESTRKQREAVEAIRKAGGLDIRDTRVTSEAVKTLQEALPNCKIEVGTSPDSHDH
jgi:hypothetical protein